MQAGGATSTFDQCCADYIWLRRKHLSVCLSGVSTGGFVVIELSFSLFLSVHPMVCNSFNSNVLPRVNPSVS